MSLTYSAAVAQLEAYAKGVRPPDPPVLVKIGVHPPIAIGGFGIRRNPAAPLPATTIEIADEATLTELRDNPGRVMMMLLKGKVKLHGERGAATALAFYLGSALKAPSK